jgi:hypothetical protein
MEKIALIILGLLTLPALIFTIIMYDFEVKGGVDDGEDWG